MSAVGEVVVHITDRGDMAPTRPNDRHTNPRDQHPFPLGIRVTEYGTGHDRDIRNGLYYIEMLTAIFEVALDMMLLVSTLFASPIL